MSLVILEFLFLIAAIVAVRIVWKELRQVDNVCARCENSKRPLKWYSMFDKWYCTPCLNIIVAEQTFILETEIGHGS